jgi:hypothetical protein
MGMMSSMMGGGKSGGSGNTPWDSLFTGEALQNNEQAIHNRYAQLGLGVDSSMNAMTAAKNNTSLTATGPSTMEQQDIGSIPTETGGLTGMANAVMGQLYNPQLAAGTNPGGPISQLQQLAGQNSQAQGNQDFQAGVSSTQGG